jgi:RNA polymerase sigma-70 factor, ECF subfamily
MSSPPGRALTFPLVLGRDQERTLSLPGPAVTSPGDEEVMVGLQRNEAGALNLLFDRYSRLVFSIALRVLNDHCEAEEVVQDSFFYLYQKSSLFDPAKGTAKAWIVQIAYNRAFDRRSYLVRRGFYTGTDVGMLDDTLLGTTDMEREVGDKLNREHLQRAFEELTETQRRTLELFYFEGLELREISEKFDEPLGNVRHHFYRGLERLRKSAFVQRLRGNGSL